MCFIVIVSLFLYLNGIKVQKKKKGRITFKFYDLFFF